MRASKIIILVLSILLIAGSLLAKSKTDNFKWEPITQADWDVQADSSLGIKDAAMIFEKIRMDDRDMIKNKCYYSVYRRLRILTEDGREYGDINIPVFDVDQKILNVRARTIRKNGDTTYLSADQIIEKEVFKSRKLKVKQKSFSIPGLSDDCIVEYRCKLKTPNHVGYWGIQKDIPLLHGELNWHIYYGKGMSKLQFQYMSSVYAPNYLSLCMFADHDVEVERLPNLKETTQLKFTIDSIKAFESEPYSLPENALKGQLHYYYTEVGTSSSFWGDYSDIFPKWIDGYIGKTKRIKKIVKTFENLATEEEKIRAAYDWVNDSLTNLTFIETKKKIKSGKYKNADKAIKSGYSKRRGISYIFLDMLREMNIDAKICWVVDRDEAVFVPDAKYWQFNRMLVTFKGINSERKFYAPGEFQMPFGQVPWYNEGITALLGGALKQIYIAIPFSKPFQNSVKRSIEISISDEFDVTSLVHEKLIGHQARSLRYILNNLNESEYITEIKEYIKTNDFDNEIDDITYGNIDSYKEPLELHYSLTFPNIENDLMGDRILLKPVAYMEDFANPFLDDERIEAVMFNYAFEDHENVILELPDEMKIEALPEDIMIETPVGKCGVSCAQVGNKLTVQRIFTLKQPYYLAKNYQAVKDFFQQVASCADLTVSLLYTEVE